LLLVVSPIGTAPQTITDGDTLKQGGVTYRLWGIDAPEAKQVCPDGLPAGSLAATPLQALTAGRPIARIVAICRGVPPWEWRAQQRTKTAQ
jgi:endonuclease YncB( thermonuclease family)